MGELLPMSNDAERLDKAAEYTTDEAVYEIVDAYGDSYMDDGQKVTVAGREATLPYHNIDHSWHTRVRALELAKATGLDEAGQRVAGLAGVAHDVMQCKPRGEMERLSADWLAEQMRKDNFPEADITAAELAVLGTEPLLNESGDMIGQRATEQAYPTERARQIAYCVASADMAALYAPYGPRLSRDLFREICGLDPEAPFPKQDFLHFQDRQLKLLQRYRFPLDMAETMWGCLRQEVVKYQLLVSAQVAKGDISSWDELAAADSEFEAFYAER